MTTTNRIYRISPKLPRVGEPVSSTRLVRAPNAAQALRHVADEFVVTLASQDDLIDLTAAGVKVESAVAEPTTGA